MKNEENLNVSSFVVSLVEKELVMSSTIQPELLDLFLKPRYNVSIQSNGIKLICN